MRTDTHEPLDSPAEHSHELRAGSLGTVGLAVFVVSAIGPVAAIIGSAPLIFAAVGSGAVVAYAIALGVFLLISVGYVAMARRLPSAGGFIVFIANAFGKRAGAAAAMLAIVSYLALLASIYAVFTVFAGELVQSLFGSDVPWIVVAAIAAAVITVASFNRVDINAKLVSAFLLIEIALVIWLIVAILIHGGPADGGGLPGVDVQSFLQGNVAVGLMWAVGSFLGFEATAVFSEEAKDSARTVRRATFLAVGFLGILFIVVSWAIVIGYGSDAVRDASIADPAGFIYALGTEYISPVWTQIMSSIVLASFALIFLGFHNIVCRYFFALGRAGFLPRALARTSRKTGAPTYAGVAVSSVCILILAVFAVTGADPYLQVYPWLYSIGAVGMYTILFFVCAAIPTYFHRQRLRGNAFATRVAPVLSAAAIGIVLTLILTNYEQLTGPSAPAIVQWGPVIVPVVLLVGYLIGRGKTDEQLSFTVANLEK